MCLPMVGAHDPQLASILTAVRANMAEINFTANADVHLMANETRLDPVAADGENYVFRVPAGVTSLRLVSLASTPAITGINDDRRLLGLSIRSITFECCSRTTMLLANDPVFTDGFHDLEGTAPDFWRWTNGDAPLPVAELGVGPGETVITLAGTCMPRYILAVPTLQQPVPSFSAA
jgi:hypothetical protein